MSKFHKKIVESSTFSLLGVYLNFFFSFIYIFFVARLISPEEWGQLILSMSFISFAVLLCNFFPPAIEASIEYYLPQLINGEDERYRIRNFLSHTFKLKLGSVGVVYIGYFLIFIFLI